MSLDKVREGILGQRVNVRFSVRSVYDGRSTQKGRGDGEKGAHGDCGLISVAKGG